MLMERRTPARRLRPAALAMLGRLITALIGGYAFAAGLATLLARLLPTARVEATVWGMIVSPMIYALVALWCFHEPRLLRVATLVWGVAGAAWASVWLLGVRP